MSTLNFLQADVHHHLCLLRDRQGHWCRSVNSTTITIGHAASYIRNRQPEVVPILRQIAQELAAGVGQSGAQQVAQGPVIVEVEQAQSKYV